jgi:hypothetical protein
VTGWVNEVARSKVPPVDATVEHERKLQAPDGFELPALGGSPLEPRVFTSVYYDVPSRSLTNAGITLRRRTERGKSVWQLKLPQADARLELEQPGGPTGPPDELRQLLLAHLRDRPVESIAELRTRRRGELVERGESTAEVTVDEVAVMNGQSVSQAFVEVEIELRSGDPSRLGKIAKEIARAGASPTNGTPKVFQALGIVPARAKRPTDPFEALRALLRIQLGEILRNDPGTRVGTDPESLHDMRVAVRRARCCAPDASSSQTTHRRCPPSCSGSARCSGPCETSTCCSNGFAPRVRRSAAATRKQPCVSCAASHASASVRAMPCLAHSATPATSSFSIASMQRSTSSPRRART